jgi:hypothetical protein
VEILPQELMRGWGRLPICKASRPNHRLGIWATHNLSIKGKKGRHGGHRGKKSAKSEKTRDEALGFEEEL